LLAQLLLQCFFLTFIFYFKTKKSEFSFKFAFFMC